MVMKALRRSTKPIIWLVVFAFLGTIFLAWGMNLASKPTAKGIIGRAAGQDIKTEQYQRMLDNAYYQYNQQNPGQEMTEQKTRELRDEAFNTIVSNIIFSKKRAELDLSLPDNELVEYLRRFPPDFLRNNPSFTTEGQFDQGKYMRAMNDPQLGQFWAKVEQLVRPQLEQAKLQEYVVSMPHVTDPEVKMMYEAAQDKRKVRYLVVPFITFAQKIGNLDSAEVEAYYAEHQEDYRQEDRVVLEYVTFAKVPSREDTSVVLNDLNEIRQELLDGADFNELARQYSEEPNAAESGGDLGWFGRKRMVAPFDSAVFSMAVGDVSAPVKTRFGYHLIKLQEKRTVNDSDQVHASHILLKVEASGRTLGDLRLQARQFIDDLADMPFDTLAESLGMRVARTNKVARGGAFGPMGRDKLLEEFAFNGKVGDISPVVDNDRFYAVCRIAELYPAGIPPLAEVRRQVEGAIRNEMGADSALALIEKIDAEVKSGKSLTDAAKIYKQEVKESDFFGRFEAVPGVSVDPAFHGTAFRLTEEHPISDIIKTASSYCLIELLGRQDADMEAYVAQRDSLYQTVLNGKRNQVYQLWYNDLQKKAEVEDFRYQIAGY